MKPTYHYFSFIFIGLVLATVLVLAIYRAEAITTLSTNSIDTTGTLVVGNNSDFTLGGAERILIDASTTDATLNTGVVDLNIDVASGSTNVVGQDMTMNVIGGVDQGGATAIGIGYLTKINAPAAGLQTNNEVYGYMAQLSGTANDESGSMYLGNVVQSKGTPAGSAQYYGNFVAFHSTYGGVNLQNSGNTAGSFIAVNKTAGTGTLVGENLTVANSSATMTEVNGYNLTLTNTAGTNAAVGHNMSLTQSAGGNLFGSRWNLTKSGGGGNTYGARVEIDNSDTTAGMNFSGQEILMNFGNATPSSSIALYISEDGIGSGVLQDGILVVSNNNNGTGITDALDVSDDDITNAIRLGTNTILASGSFPIDLVNTSATTLTIRNSDNTAGATASLAVDGSIFHAPSANVASAATTALTTGNVFHITGTTDITTLNTCDATNNGRVVFLVFDGVLTFTDGGALKLAGNFVTTADDTITLACDGTNWYELDRSVN